MLIRSRFIFQLLFCFGFTAVWSQTAQLTGLITGNGDVENIHVINRTSNLFTTTNALGVFRITATYKDTIQFTSVRFKKVTIVVSYKNIQEKSLNIFLEENINVLDEVIVGKILTGELDSDIGNSDAKRPIDFYDIGLPGYTGKPLTQSERRLEEARSSQPGTIPILPLINAISGRTKAMKERVRLERQSALLKSIKDRLSKDFFNVNSLDSVYREEFFFFCSEDEAFEMRCSNKSDIEIYGFIEEKYTDFLINLKTRED